MNNGYWQLIIKDSFGAAHALRNYKGKCEALHGHNFDVKICVEGQKLSGDTEILMDFTILKQELKKVLATFDHKNLNEIEEFSTHNPSSENISRLIYKMLKPALQNHNVTLVYAEVAETNKQSARYLEK